MADSDKIQSNVLAGDVILASHINTIVDNLLTNLPRACATKETRTSAQGVGLQTIYTGFRPRSMRIHGSRTTSGGTQTFTIGNVVVEALELFKYADTAAIQAVWAETGDADAITQNASGGVVGEGHASVAYTFSTGAATITAPVLQQYDLRRLVGVDSGVPTRGTLVMSFKKGTDTCSGATIRIGSNSSNYLSIPLAIAATTGAWITGRAAMSAGTETGTVDWENIDYLQIILDVTATGSVDLDSLILLNENTMGGDDTYNTQSSDALCYEQIEDSHWATFGALGERHIALEWTLFTGAFNEVFYITATN